MFIFLVTSIFFVQNFTARLYTLFGYVCSNFANVTLSSSYNFWTITIEIVELFFII